MQSKFCDHANLTTRFCPHCGVATTENPSSELLRYLAEQLKTSRSLQQRREKSYGPDHRFTKKSAALVERWARRVESCQKLIEASDQRATA